MTEADDIQAEYVDGLSPTARRLVDMATRRAIDRAFTAILDRNPREFNKMWDSLCMIGGYVYHGAQWELFNLAQCSAGFTDSWLAMIALNPCHGEPE